MKVFRGKLLFGAVISFWVSLSASGAAKPIKIVAAENFYAEIATQIGGPDVEVASILNNPGQDPHAFEASSSTAREIASADIVVLNGLAYDPWMENLLNANRSANQVVLNVGQLSHHHEGDNPHIWYDIASVQAYSMALAEALSKLRPETASALEERRNKFNDSLDALTSEVSKVAAAHKKTPVAATEPVFGYMLTNMGFEILETRFQQAVMNDVEPAISDVAQFEKDIRERKIGLLIVNKQTSDPSADKLVALAKGSGVPVVGVTETMPAETSYQAWLKSEIEAVSKALESAQ